MRVMADGGAGFVALYGLVGSSLPPKQIPFIVDVSGITDIDGFDWEKYHTNFSTRLWPFSPNAWLCLTVNSPVIHVSSTQPRPQPRILGSSVQRLLYYQTIEWSETTKQVVPSIKAPIARKSGPNTLFRFPYLSIESFSTDQPPTPLLFRTPNKVVQSSSLSRDYLK